MKMLKKIQKRLRRTRRVLEDRWLTWRTGKTKPEREWDAWVEQTIVKRAGTIRGMFPNHKHIITVDHRKVFDLNEPFGWVPNKEFKKFLFPKRPLGDNCVWVFERGIWIGDEFHLNGMGEGDYVFVATNSDEDVVMLTLKFI